MSLDKTVQHTFNFAAGLLVASGLIVAISAASNNRVGCSAEDYNVAINPAYQLLGIGSRDCSPGYTR